MAIIPDTKNWTWVLERPCPECGFDLEPAALQNRVEEWFATWDGAKAEAKRTNRPILMVSAAPHCSGISGIW